MDYFAQILKYQQIYVKIIAKSRFTKRKGMLMIKKTLIILTIILLIILIGITLHIFNILSSIPGRPASTYSETPITLSLDKNEKMMSLLDLDTQIINYTSLDSTVNVKTLDLVPDSVESAANNSKIFNAAVKSVQKGTRIIIPSGKYYLDGSIKLFNKKDISICGDTYVSFINTSYRPFSNTEQSQQNIANFFNVVNCSNIKIENITFDYLNHTSADGIITRIENGKTYFQAYPEFADGEKKPLIGNEHITSVLTANDHVFVEEKWPDEFMTLEKGVCDGEFSISMEIGKAGDRICCRFTTGTYISYVIHVLNTSGFVLKNLTCNSCPSGFILAPNGNSDFFFTGLNVSVKGGSQKLLGSNEDCMHIRNLSGKLVITDCNFNGIGDDALNIHSELAIVSEVSEDTVCITSGRENVALSKSYALPGETVEFFDKNYNSLGFATVRKTENGKMTLDSLPDKVNNGTFVQNVSCAPDTLIKNCKIEFGRARGLLIQTKNAVITDCTFRNIRLSGILMSPDFEYWHEAGFTENVLIQNNTFENCASLQSGFGVIHISTSHDNSSVNALCKKGHKNISILDNQFINCKSRRIIAIGVQNLKSDIYNQN